MNIKLDYFTDNALHTLELAVDEAICAARPLVDGQMEAMVLWHKRIVEERMRREARR